MYLWQCRGDFSGQGYCRLLWTWKELRPGSFQKHYALCDGVLVCIWFSRSLALLIFNFLALFCSNLYIRNFLTTILWHVLRTWPDFWDGVFCKTSYRLSILCRFWGNLCLRCLMGLLTCLCVGVYDVTQMECF